MQKICVKPLPRREGMGYGDIKYLAALGAWHGWCVLPILALVAALMALLYLVAFSLFTPDKQGTTFSLRSKWKVNQAFPANA